MNNCILFVTIHCIHINNNMYRAYDWSRHYWLFTVMCLVDKYIIFLPLESVLINDQCQFRQYLSENVPNLCNLCVCVDSDFL